MSLVSHAAPRPGGARFAALTLGALLLWGAPPAFAAPARSLTVLSVTDLKGKSSPCGCHTPKGGFSRQASFIDSTRIESGEPLVVYTGGFSSEQADPAYREVNAFAMQMMVTLGADAASLDARDLLQGRAALVNDAAAAKLPIVCANLSDPRTHRTIFPASRIVTLNGVKVGVFGLVSDKVDLGPARDSLVAGEPMAAARAAVTDLRRHGATVVVLLSSLGKVESEDLVTAVDGVDLVVASHNIPLLQQGRMVKNTIVCYGGEQGQYIGRTRIQLDSRGAMTTGSNETFMLGPDVGEHPATLTMVKTFEDHFNAEQAKAEKERVA